MFGIFSKGRDLMSKLEILLEWLRTASPEEKQKLLELIRSLPKET